MNLILFRLRVLLFHLVTTIFLALTVLLWIIPLYFIGAPYEKRYYGTVVFSYVFVWLAWLMCGVKYRIEGFEKLPKQGPYLALSNHQSFWENYFVQLLIPTHSWVVKKELCEIPIFGWGFKTLDPIAVDRSDTYSVIKICNQSKEKFKDNLPVVMFPEATRVKVSSNVRFKPSAAKVALENNVPIVLIAHNAGLLWPPKGFWLNKPGTITVRVIETISREELVAYDVRSLTEYIQERINSAKNELASEGTDLSPEGQGKLCTD